MLKARRLLTLALTIAVIWLASPSAEAVLNASPRLVDPQQSSAGGITGDPVNSRYAWDDADSHRWMGEPWGDPIVVDWVPFDGRDTLQAQVTPTTHNWAVMRTNAFPAEDWRTQLALRAAIYPAGGAPGLDAKLEVRGPGYDTPDLIEQLTCQDLTVDTWNTCTWTFSATAAYSQVAHLSLVFEQLAGTEVTFYLDELRLVDAAGETTWDDMDDGSRAWQYSGNWYDWNPLTPFGLEPITHHGQNPTTPAGAAFLQWDYEEGVAYPSTIAELGTAQAGDPNAWASANYISADMKTSNVEAPISVFLWDQEGRTSPVDCRGFGVPAQHVTTAATWETLTWALPWPPCFDPTGIDEVKFVVQDIDQAQVGTLYVDNIHLISQTLPAPLTGLTYVFEDFNDHDPAFNDFGGNWGTLVSDALTTSFSSAVRRGTWGAALRVDYDLPLGAYTGIWQSLWGHAEYTQTQVLDLTDTYGSLHEPDQDVDQLHFWVRGSGTTTATHNVKVELKDHTGADEHTAYRYLEIDDADTRWQRIVLDADVTNADFWSYPGSPPDPTHMKQLVLVIERAFNAPTGTFYLDDISFVDADAQPFDPEHHTEDEFLAHVSQKTFLYFLDRYDPNTGLFQDRSTAPDLMSTAATGFGLTALTIGESRDWIERDVAVEMITRTLRTLVAGQSPTDTVTDTITGTNGYQGFFYHFLGADGLRKDTDSELSPVDTAILLAGILTAREHFRAVPELVSLADQLYERVAWDWMLDPANDLFYLGWKPTWAGAYQVAAPGGGYFSTYYWDYTTDEVLLINLLAMGSPTHAVPKDVFYAWQRHTDDYVGHSLVHSWNGSFFTYLFAHLWFDFETLGTDNHPTHPVNWWDNSVAAAKASWQFSVDHRDTVPCDGDADYTTYGEQSWGLTAAEGPDAQYHAYGALPAAIAPDHDGTVAPYGAGMAVPLLPERAISALQHYMMETDLWRHRFGYGDAYNLDSQDCGGPWYNHAAFGIDQGPLLIAIENYRSGLIWQTIERNPDLRSAMNLIWPPEAAVYLPLILKP